MSNTVRVVVYIKKSTLCRLDFKIKNQKQTRSNFVSNCVDEVLEADFANEILFMFNPKTRTLEKVPQIVKDERMV